MWANRITRNKFAEVIKKGKTSVWNILNEKMTDEQQDEYIKLLKEAL